jgi:hypothetical protein
MLEEILTWHIPFLLVVAVISYVVYKPTIVYDIVQRAAIGTASAYGLVRTVETLQSDTIIPIGEGEIVLIIPVILGILIFTRFSREWTWVSRYPQTLMAGTAVGLSMALVFRGQIFNSAVNTGYALFESSTPLDIFSNIILVVGVVSSLLFYTYSRPHTGTYGRIARIGRIFTLCAIGTSMANEYAWSNGVLVERVDFLINYLRHIGIPL